jgi:hypothetical protein
MVARLLYNMLQHKGFRTCYFHQKPGVGASQISTIYILINGKFLHEIDMNDPAYSSVE